MPTKKVVKKSAAKKTSVPKLPPIKFSEVYLRGSGFDTDVRQKIANFMDSKGEKQATTAVMRMIRQYYRQAEVIQDLIKDKNQLQEKLELTQKKLIKLHGNVSRVIACETELSDQRSTLYELESELSKELPKENSWDDEDNDHDEDWDSDFDKD
jgi:hypothetical protein